MHFFNLVLLVALVLVSCQKEDDCSEAGTQPVDVIAGSPFYIGGFGDPAWAFLSDERSKVSDAVLFTTYPFFLNSPPSCEDHYMLNVIEPLPRTNSMTGEAEDVVRLTSYLNVPMGQAVTLLPEIEDPSFPRYTWEARTILIRDIPSGADLEFLSDISGFMPWELDETLGEIRLEAPAITGSLRYTYLVARLPEGDTDLAIRLDFVEGPDVYDFSTAAQEIELRTIQVTGDVKWVVVAEVIDIENGEVLILGAKEIEDGQVQYWVPKPDASYLVQLTMRFDSAVQHQWREIFTSFPAELTAPQPPIDELLWSEQYLGVKLNQEGYLNAEMDKAGQFYAANYRGMRGVLAAGQHHFTMPYLPNNFLSEYPSVNLPTDLYKHGHKVEFWHFSAVPNQAAYWEVDELPWAIQHRFHHYLVDIW